MANKNINITDTTSKFIQALRTLLIAESQLSEGFNIRYGEDNTLYKDSGLPDMIEELKEGIKKVIGDSMEVSMGENWKPTENEFNI